GERGADAVSQRRQPFVLGLLGLLFGCGGDQGFTGPVSTPPRFILSSPIPSPTASVRRQGTSSVAAASAAGADTVVYASLLPGTAPGGVTATVRALQSSAAVTTDVQDGGFDPVAVTARVGDTVEIVVRDGAGSV